ncbi:MAG: toll/interleukin-1 receptor domain-containing protein [Deltaproteobacteria bacterium]|nr:toll/interleukin-1 receptor domain-containing protein [Deltaproteobacteria bacterium]
MSDIFLSHVQEDAAVALQIALGLEAAGYSTWCYEIDSVPGPSYLVQTGEAIEKSQAVILLISSAALASHQISREVDRAHENGKPIVPILCDVTHDQFQQRAPAWRQAIGTATSFHIPAKGIDTLVPELVRGLAMLGAQSTGTCEDARIALLQKQLTEQQAKPQTAAVHRGTSSETRTSQQTSSMRASSALAQHRLTKARWLSALAAAVAVLFLVLALLPKSVYVTGDLKVSQLSFVIGEPIPSDLFRSINTKAFTLSGVDSVLLGDGTLEVQEVQQAQTADAGPWRSLGHLESVTIGLVNRESSQVTLREVSLNGLDLQPHSTVMFSWLEAEPHSLNVHVSRNAVTGKVVTPPTLQFSCVECPITDKNGREYAGARWRLGSDSRRIVHFQSAPGGVTLGLDLAESILWKETDSPIPIADAFDLKQLDEENGTEASTIIGEGKIAIEEVGREIGVRPRDFVIFKKLSSVTLRPVSLDTGLRVAVAGSVGELRTGTKGAMQSRLPSVLAWLHHQETLVLYLSVMLFLVTTVVAILERWKIIPTGA